MNFWRTVAVVGLILLCAQVVVCSLILSKMPPPSPTFGQWRQKMTQEERQVFVDKLPVSETFTYIDGQPVEVKVTR